MECSVTTSEEQEETVHELRGNAAYAPVGVIPVAVSTHQSITKETSSSFRLW